MSTIALIAGGGSKGDRLFDPATSRDNVLERFRLLREALSAEGHVCRTADMLDPSVIDVLIFHDVLNELDAVLRIVKANPQVRLIYVANEPSFVAPLHDHQSLARLPVDCVLTWNDLVAGKVPHVVKCNIGQPIIHAENIPCLSFAGKKLICAIFANKPSLGENLLFVERVRAVEFFAQQPLGMDLYGIGWENTGSDILESAYRGKCASKREVLQGYRFSLAYENVKGLPGLITEKIFDCFDAGTVPIYLGAPNIEDYIPKACFVDAKQFDDYAQLYAFLANMPEAEYQRYLDAAKSFITSAAYQAFTSSTYVSIMVAQIKMLTSQHVAPKSVQAIKLRLLGLVIAGVGSLQNWKLFKRFFYTVATVW